MEQTVLELHKMRDSTYQAYIKTNHGRKIYLHATIIENNCQIIECFYIDRVKLSKPNLLVTVSFPLCELLDVVASELDRVYYSYVLLDGSCLSTEEFISRVMKKEKYSILIMLKEGTILKTILGTRTHRKIYLEIDTSGERALVTDCHYCDKRAKKSRSVTPYRLTTVYFDYNHDNLLKLVNYELECGFSDVVITEDHTIDLDRPICESI